MSLKFKPTLPFAQGSRADWKGYYSNSLGLPFSSHNLFAASQQNDSELISGVMGWEPIWHHYFLVMSPRPVT